MPLFLALLALCALTPLPRRVHLQPLLAPSPQIQALVDSTGAYTAEVSAGPYAVSAVDALDLRLIEGRGLSAGRLADMLKPQSRAPADRGGQAAGLGLFLIETPCGTAYGHGGRNGGPGGGYFTSQSAVLRDQKVGYVFLTNSDQARAFDQALQTFLIAGTAGCR